MDATTIIPVYNGADFLGEAIESAVEQGPVIVVDDCSEDASYDVARGYPVEVLRTEENGGTAHALNVGIERAVTPFVCWLSHDDRYLPGKIERQLEVFRLFQDVGVCFGEAEYINGEGRVFKRERVEPAGWSTFEMHMLVHANIINGSTVMMRKEVAYFPEDVPCAEDGLLWAVLMGKGIRFHHMKDFLIQYRFHEKQVSRLRSVQMAEMRDMIALTILKGVEPGRLFGGKEHRYDVVGRIMERKGFSNAARFCQEVQDSSLDGRSRQAQGLHEGGG